jgi:hypothetical protein
LPNQSDHSDSSFSDEFRQLSNEESFSGTLGSDRQRDLTFLDFFVDLVFRWVALMTLLSLKTQSPYRLAGFQI